MNEATISWLLATRQSSPFYCRQQLCVVPNVSWGLIPWEADLLVLSKSRYLSEIEIKISISDWKADLGKTKFDPSAYSEAERHTKIIKGFWYAGPIGLMSRFKEIQIIESAGIIAIGSGPHQDRIEILRPAIPNPKAEKLDDVKTMKLLRLAALKAWKLAHSPSNSELKRTAPVQSC